MRAIGVVSVLVVMASLLGSCTGGGAKSTITPTSASGSTPAAGAPGTVDLKQQAGTYELELIVGPTEMMYSPQQVASQHLTTGEEMLSGKMLPAGTPMSGTAGPTTTGGMGAMASGANTRHLELHVRTADGAVVNDAQVTISVVDNTSNGMTETVPIATMQGIKEGAPDFHYGNNVEMPVGHDYTVNVSVNGSKGQFQFTLR